jgi:selenocysteine-specific translation elongation factor
MRLSLIVGALCIVLGGLVLFRVATYTDTKKIAQVGDVTLNDKDHHPVPIWVGVCFTVAGVGLVVQGMTDKKN